MSSEPCVECGGHHFGLRHGEWLHVRESVATELQQELVDELERLRRAAERAHLALKDGEPGFAQMYLSRALSGGAALTEETRE